MAFWRPLLPTVLSLVNPKLSQSLLQPNIPQTLEETIFLVASFKLKAWCPDILDRVKGVFKFWQAILYNGLNFSQAISHYHSRHFILVKYTHLIR